MYRAIVIQSEDWEGLYIDGQLVDEGHSLSDHDWLYWVRTFHHYNLEIKDACPSKQYVTPEDEAMVESTGRFPKSITNFNHDYTKTSV